MPDTVLNGYTIRAEYDPHRGLWGWTAYVSRDGTDVSIVSAFKTEIEALRLADKLRAQRIENEARDEA